MTTIHSTAKRLLAASKDVLLGMNLGSLGLVTRPRLLRHYMNDIHFLRRTVISSKVHSRAVSEVLAYGGDIHLRSFPNGDNWLNWGPSFTQDIANLCVLCRALNPKQIFEIGTFHGYTTVQLAINSSHDAVIHTLDLGPNADTSLPITEIDRMVIDLRETSSCLNAHNAATKIRRLFGDSAEFDFSPYHQKIDLFFIDGSHSYQYVKSDTTNALRCCHSGSAIAWHDYGREQFGVTSFLEELAEQMDIYVVPGGSLAFTILQ